MLKIKNKFMNPFHLAIPVSNLSICRIFYNEVLECTEGRSSENWVDFNFFGHQLVIHQKPNLEINEKPTALLLMGAGGSSQPKSKRNRCSSDAASSGKS